MEKARILEMEGLNSSSTSAFRQLYDPGQFSSCKNNHQRQQLPFTKCLLRVRCFVYGAILLFLIRG